MIYQNILDAIGNTPMIQLNHIVPKDAARVLVRSEEHTSELQSR